MEKTVRVTAFLLIFLTSSLSSVRALVYHSDSQNMTQTIKDTKLWVDSFDGTRDQWTKNGVSPYLDNQDQTGNYVYGIANGLGSRQGDKIGDYGFEDHAQTGTIISVELKVYGHANSQHPNQNYFSVYLWDGSSWRYVMDFKGASGYIWKEADITSYLDTWEKVNQAKIYLQTESKGDRGGQSCDAALLVVRY